MRSRNGFLVHTKTSVSNVIKTEVPVQARSAPACVIVGEFDPPAPELPAGGIDIDDLAAEFERDPEAHGALQEARRWVSETFYTESPPSLSRLRLDRGLSQRQLGNLAGTTQSHIARIEKGTCDPQASTVKRIAVALGLPSSAVLDALPEPKDAPGCDE